MSIQSNQEKNEEQERDDRGGTNIGGDVGQRVLSTGKRSTSEWIASKEDQGDELELNSKHVHDLSFNQELKGRKDRNSVLPLLSLFDNDHSRRNVFHQHTKQHALSPHQSMMFRNSENNNEQHGARSNSVFERKLDEMEEGGRQGGKRRSNKENGMDSSTLDFAPFFNQVRRRRLEEEERISQTLMRYPDGIHSSLLPSSKFISHLSKSHDSTSSTDSFHKVLVDGHLFRVLSSDLVQEESDGSHLNELRLRHVSPEDSGEYICLSRHPPNSSGYTFQNAFLTLLTESKFSSLFSTTSFLHRM